MARADDLTLVAIYRAKAEKLRCAVSRALTKTSPKPVIPRLQPSFGRKASA